MKNLIAIAALLLLFPTLVPAQSADHSYRSQGYVFIGEGLVSEGYGHYSGISHVGAGGEVLLFKGLGVGGELGAMGRPGDGVGVFSIDPSYHFLHASSKSKAVPFVEGGYTRTFDNNVVPSNLFNFGAGIQYWAFKRVGLRLEFRDHVRIGSSFDGTRHYRGLRIGLAVR